MKPGQVQLSPFGQTGPDATRPASGLVVQAVGGSVKRRGWPAGEPVQLGGQFEEYAAAAYTATSALTVLAGARQNGTGFDADLSRAECVHATLTFPTVTRTILGTLGRGTSMEPLLGVKRCADGWVGVNVLTHQHWSDLCAMVGLPGYTSERERLRQGGEDRALFERQVEDWTRAHTVGDIVEACQRVRIPATPVHDGESALRSPQWQARRFFGTEASEQRRFRHPSFPWRFSETPAMMRAPAPALGSAEPDVVLADWPHRAIEPPASESPRLPLEGIRVLDLGTYWAGAGCTSYLGSIGAEVIKVESVQRPDGWRFNMIGPALGSRPYERGRYRATNLNKRGLTLNLGDDRGRDLFLRLVSTADVLVENYAARVMDRLRLGWSEIEAVNPRLVMVRMPGFGLTGPWRDYVGFGPSFVYASGHTALTGFAGGPPLNPGGQMDPMVATVGAFAVLAGLRHVERTGRGQLVEVPQIEVGACLAPEPVIRHSLTGSVMTRTGNRSATAAPQGVYRARDGRYVALTVSSDGVWRNLVRVMGSPEWATDNSLATVGRRHQQHDRLDEGIGLWVGGQSAADLVRQLVAADVAAAVVAETGDFLTDPQLQARGYYERVDHALQGEDTYPGWPMRFHPAPQQSHRLPCPLLGEHNLDILGAELGLGADTIARLTHDQVIGTEPLTR